MWKLRAEVGAEVESGRKQKEGAEVECESWEQRLRVEESGPQLPFLPLQSSTPPVNCNFHCYPPSALRLRVEESGPQLPFLPLQPSTPPVNRNFHCYPPSALNLHFHPPLLLYFHYNPPLLLPQTSKLSFKPSTSLLNLQNFQVNYPFHKSSAPNFPLQLPLTLT